MRTTSDPFLQQIARALLVTLIFVIPFSKAAIEILFPILLVFWLAARVLFTMGRSQPGKMTLLALLAYLGICAWSVSYSHHPLTSVRGFIGKNLEYTLLFLIASDIANHPSVALSTVRSLQKAGWLVGLYAVLQQMTGRDFFRGRPLLYARMIGPYENPNDLATFLIVVTLILLAYVLAQPDRSQTKRWALLALLLGCLVLTQSRAALIGFSFGFLLLLLLLRERRKVVWMSVGFGFLIVFGFSSLRNELWEVLTLSDIASKDRLVMWNTAWRMILDRPLFGHGLNTFMANYLAYVAGPTNGPAYAHNCFLQIAAETGIVGLLTFLWFLSALFRMYWHPLGPQVTEVTFDHPEIRETRFALIGIAAGMAAFLVQSAFDTNLYALRQAALFWTLSGVGAGLSARLSYAQELPVRTVHVPLHSRQQVAG